ncbi:HAD family hydrolase [Streptomyces sp. NPDC058812]|uniref:HAD family hydrolase n=1 Tax=unclassified Streptomyces TaxID=2593676 RepID=UPI0036B793EE
MLIRSLGCPRIFPPGSRRCRSGAVYRGVDIFAALRAQGRALAVFTGASSRAAGMLVRSAGLHVDVLIGGDHVSRPKPAPDGILLAAKEIGIDAVDIAYVGGSPLDLRAAVGAGSRGAAEAWGHMYGQAERADVVLSGPCRHLISCSSGTS